MTYWPDEQLDRITPPGATDARGRAVMRALSAFVGGQPLSDFYVRDADTCPAEALPALIAEYSLEEYITPGLPEFVLRRIIKHAWFLHEAKGYDAGVQLGLSLLGVTADIRHWHQEEPVGAPNTHRITFYIGEQLFPDSDALLGAGEVRAAIRMNDATKRWSQESVIEVGVGLRPHPIRAAAHLTPLTLTRFNAPTRQREARPRITRAVGAHVASVTLTRFRLAG